MFDDHYEMMIRRPDLLDVPEMHPVSPDLEPMQPLPLVDNQQDDIELDENDEMEALAIGRCSIVWKLKKNKTWNLILFIFKWQSFLGVRD